MFSDVPGVWPERSEYGINWVLDCLGLPWFREMIVEYERCEAKEGKNLLC